MTWHCPRTIQVTAHYSAFRRPASMVFSINVGEIPTAADCENACLLYMAWEIDGYTPGGSEFALFRSSKSVLARVTARSIDIRSNAVSSKEGPPLPFGGQNGSETMLETSEAPLAIWSTYDQDPRHHGRSYLPHLTQDIMDDDDKSFPAPDPARALSATLDGWVRLVEEFVPWTLVRLRTHRGGVVLPEAEFYPIRTGSLPLRTAGTQRRRTLRGR